MSSQITKLVLVPLEEWKQINKNGGDTYTTVEIPSFKSPQNEEVNGKKEEKQDAITPLLLLLFLIVPQSRERGGE